MRLFASATAAILALTFAAATPALAEFYGDVTRTFGDGKLGVEGAYTNLSRPVEFDGGGSDDLDYTELSAVISRGVGGQGQLMGRLGTVSIDTGGADEDGFGLGVGYRHTFGAGTDLPKGAFARFALVNAGDIQFTQIDVGFGVSHALEKNLRVYGGGLVSQLSGDVDTGFGKADFSEKHEIGLFGGGIFQLDQSLGIGFEIHALFENGFVLLLEMAL